MEKHYFGAESVRGCARQRKKPGPKLMKQCKLEKMNTKEHGKMKKRILLREEESVPAKNARGWKIEGQNRRVTKKECKRLREEFEVEGFTAQKGLWNIAKSKKLEDRGALPREDGDLLREYQAMHEENFLTSWLRGDV